AARSHEDVALEQLLGEPLSRALWLASRRRSLRHAPPQIEGRVAAVVLPALLLEELDEEIAAAAIGRDHSLHVGVVAPGRRRGGLHEVGGRDADRRPEAGERRDQRQVAGDEAAAVAGHRAALAAAV